MPPTINSLRATALALLFRAVADTFPKAQFLRGAVTDHGFVYDILLEGQIFDVHALRVVEERMIALIQENIPIKTVEMSCGNAVNYFRHRGQSFQALVAEERETVLLSLVDVGGFYDIFDAKDLASVDELKAFRLICVEPVFVEFSDGDEVNATRIVGTAFATKNDLKAYLKKRDSQQDFLHDRLCREMKLCYYQEGCSREPTYWLPKGVELKNSLTQWWAKNLEEQEILRVAFRKGTVDPQEGFRDLVSRLAEDRGQSLRLAEMQEVSGNGESPRIAGLWRSSSFLSEKSYHFVEREVFFQEIISSLQSIRKTVMLFGLDCHWQVCQGCGLGSKQNKQWEKFSTILVEALESCGFPYVTESSSQPLARAYILLPDLFGAMWKGPFVGLEPIKDYELGDAMNAQAPLAVITRSMFGSLDRFIAFLLEHYKGQLPFWLAPEQVRVIVQNVATVDYARSIEGTLKEKGVRVCVDKTEQKLGAKMHAALKEKVPYIIVVGDAECRDEKITLRAKAGTELARTLTLDAFLDEIKEEAKINPLLSI